MRAVVTVMVDHGPGHTTIESTTLRIPQSLILRADEIVANAAKYVAQRAIFGRLQPTLRREGGRG